MRYPTRFLAILAFALLTNLTAPTAEAQRRMEDLGRGITIVRTGTGSTYIGWRLLGDEPTAIGFNLYRSIGAGAPVLVNTTGPITTSTNYADSPGSGALASAVSYTVVPVLGGVEQPGAQSATLAANSISGRQFFTIPFTTAFPNPASASPYSVKFAWVGDFDGDGEYDFLVDRVSTSTTAERQYLEAYRRDGTFLWRMDMGPNSVNQATYEPGSSAISVGDTDNVTVYDLDSNGVAEVIVRTANGVVVTNAAGTQVASITAASNTSQFVSVFNGLTGVELARTALPNPWAQHGTLTNKCAIAYLDGREPSVVFYGYNRADSEEFYRVFSTFDYRNGTLSLRWTLAQNQAVMPGAEGHQIRIADVDNDGRDEICDLGHVIDDDGTQLFYTELTHGDRFHIADIDPDRPGLETYAIQQNNATLLANTLYESGTGLMLRKWYSSSVVDVGRGIALDMTAAHRGYEMYSTQPGIFNAKGTQIYANNLWAPEGLWWDGDLLREFIDGAGSGAYNPVINKFNPTSGAADRLWTVYNDAGDFSIRQAFGGRPAFWGDITGDWREELVFVTSDNTGLRVYTTATVTPHRLYTLMHNPQYRTQATTKGYVQASYVDYYLGDGMTPPQPPPMADAAVRWRGGPGTSAWDSATASWWRGAATSAFANGDSVLFDLTGNTSAAVALSGNLSPSSVTVYSPTNYTFDGTSGSLIGTASLTKAGSGLLTITGSHSYSGATTVWDGELRVNATLSSSPVTVWGGIWGGALSKGRVGGRLSGNGTLSQPVLIDYRGALTPGGGMDSAGTLTLGAGLTARNGSVLGFDLPVSPGGTSDRVNIAGSLALQGTVTIVLSSPTGYIAPGVYTLATFSGVSGSLSNLSLVSPPGVPCSLALTAGTLTVTVLATRPADSVVWKGGLNGNIWDLATTQNWLRSGNADVFVGWDHVLLDESSSPNTTINMPALQPVASLTVSGTANHTISGNGGIAGTGGLTKSGSGMLTLSVNSTYTGITTISGGTISVQTLSDGGRPGGIGAATSAASNLVLNGGNLRYTGESNGVDRGVTLGASGGTVTINGSGTALVIGGLITGNGALTKSGAGTLVINGSNNHTGGTIAAQGRIVLGSDTANVSGLGSGTLTFQGGTVSMADNWDITSAATSTWPIQVATGQTGRLELDGRCSLSGALTGGGDLTVYAHYVRSELKGNWSAFTGRILTATDADGGEYRMWSTAGMPSAELFLATNVNASYQASIGSSITVPLGALSGNSGSLLRGGINSGRTITWQIGARNTNTTFSGAITNATGPSALQKVGTGTLTLAGASTYTGATTVSAGRLQLSGGSLSGSTVTVQASAGFGGNGTVTGNVTFASGSVLVAAPAAGPLAITGNLTLSGPVTVSPAAGAALTPGSYPILTYTGTLTGTPQFTWTDPSGIIGTFDTSLAGTVRVILSAPPRQVGLLVWTGSQSAIWDLATSNWTLDGVAEVFKTGDSARFDNTSAVTAIQIASVVEPAAVTFDSTQNHSVSGAGSISGAATLAKSGTGTLTLSTAQAYTGGTTLNAGTIVLGNAAALGTGSITLNGGVLDTGALTPNNNIVIGGTATIRGGNGGGTHGIKNVSGSGALTIDATNVFDLEGSMSQFSGTVTLSGVGSVRLFGTSGSSLARWDLGSRNLNARSGAAFNLGGLAGTSAAVLQGASGTGNTTAVTYTVGALGQDSEFAGAIVNGGGTTSLVKTGAGRLTLSGPNTYTGVTSVLSGSILLSGSLGASAVSVGSTAAFGGNGSAAGSLTMASGSTLLLGVGSSSTRGPAFSGVATLTGTINVVPAAQGGTLLPGTHTLLSFSGALSGTPTFAWTNAPGDDYIPTFSIQSGSVTLLLETPLQFWMRSAFGTSSPTDEAAYDADFDRDGTANLVEYALNTPGAAANLSPIVTDLAGGVLRLTFPTRADPRIVYGVEAAGSIAGPWTSVWSRTGSSNIGDTVAVSDSVPPGPTTPRFLRLVVSYTQP